MRGDSHRFCWRKAVVRRYLLMHQHVERRRRVSSPVARLASRRSVKVNALGNHFNFRNHLVHEIDSGVVGLWQRDAKRLSILITRLDLCSVADEQFYVVGMLLGSSHVERYPSARRWPSTPFLKVRFASGSPRARMPGRLPKSGAWLTLP